MVSTSSAPVGRPTSAASCRHVSASRAGVIERSFGGPGGERRLLIGAHDRGPIGVVDGKGCQVLLDGHRALGELAQLFGR